MYVVKLMALVVVLKKLDSSAVCSQLVDDSHPLSLLESLFIW